MDRLLMMLHDGTVLSLAAYDAATEALTDPGAAPQARLAKVLGEM